MKLTPSTESHLRRLIEIAGPQSGRGGVKTEVTTVGICLAKNVFSIHAISIHAISKEGKEGKVKTPESEERRDQLVSPMML